MDTILLISEQPTLVEKWQPVLALNHVITVSTVTPTKDFNAYALWVVDAQMLDRQLFDLALIKQNAVKCLVVGESWPEALQVEALLAGVAGYCEVTVSASIVLKALECVLQGDIWMQRHIIHKVIGALIQPEGIRADNKASAAVDANFACLSKREQDVAHLICEGVSNKRIASTLFISERTVKAHLTSIFNKLNVTNRLHLGLLLKKAEE